MVDSSLTQAIQGADVKHWLKVSRSAIGALLLCMSWPSSLASAEASPLLLQEPQLQVAQNRGQSIGQNMGQVTGTVTYRQRIALPDNAIVEVKLQEVSRLDAPAVTIAEQTIPSEGQQVPFAFTLDYDPSQINPRYTYAIQARITVDGELQWINTTAYQVITQGYPSTVEIYVEPATANSPSRLPRPSSPASPQPSPRPSPESSQSSQRYDCTSQTRAFPSAQNISLEAAQELRLQRNGDRFVYQCAPTTASPNQRYDCRSEVKEHPDRNSVTLTEAEILLMQQSGSQFIYECRPS
jgi:uncharacterized lipoprotein YbaY